MILIRIWYRPVAWLRSHAGPRSLDKSFLRRLCVTHNFYLGVGPEAQDGVAEYLEEPRAPVSPGGVGTR